MPTHFMGIPYMTPSQINKDLVFNEAITLLDNFCTISVSNLVDVLPQGQKDVKYIMTAGDMRHHIAYHSAMIGDWRYIKPQKNMLVFVTAKMSYAIYNGEKWVLVRPEIEPVILTQPGIKVYENSKSILLEGGNTFFISIDDVCEVSFGPEISGENTIIFSKTDLGSVAIRWNTDLSWLNDPYSEIPEGHMLEIVKIYIIPGRGVISSIVKK